MLRRSTILSGLALTLLAGCASTPKDVAIAPPPPAPPVAVAMPRGAYPGMAIPALLADGHYATPNRNLSAAGSVWHLRAALNVAALGCRAGAEAALAGQYNAMLTARKPELAAAETSLSAEFRAGGGQWQDRYDDAMTRLYNFFATAQAHDRFCAAAVQVMAAAQAVAPGELSAFAARELPVLDAAFVQPTYRPMPARPIAQPVIAIAAGPTATRPTAHPRLDLDLSTLPAD